MNCPICKKTVTAGSDFYPFCSERCKLIDLGNWSSEKYVISTPLKPGEEEKSDEPDEA
jgi:endogenous inhibitor of DNA gyrase (YacG/DUF329 family)